jgi:Mce-associated membrane protein
VPSFRRRDSVIDADRPDKPPKAPEPVAAEQALALADEAEAEAAEADAIAAAARARARAIRLRREAQQAAEVEDQDAEVESGTADVEARVADVETEGVELDDYTSIDEADGSITATDETQDRPVRSRWRRLPRPSWTGIAAAVVVLFTVALLAVSGYMIWTHRAAEKLQQQSAEYAAAGRQSVVTLMSLDFNKADEGVQRIIDNSTGQFKDDFEQQASDFVQVAKDSKVITEVTVNSVAVESMTNDKAVVLVAASSRVTNSKGANQEPRTWRLSVDLQREGDQIKMSKVEFVP